MTKAAMPCQSQAEKWTCTLQTCHRPGALSCQSAMMPRTAPFGGQPVVSILGAQVHWLLKPVGVQHWLSSTSCPPMVARQDHRLLLDLNFPPGSSSCTAMPSGLVHVLGCLSQLVQPPTIPVSEATCTLACHDASQCSKPDVQHQGGPPYLHGATKVAPIRILCCPIKAGLQPRPPCLPPMYPCVAVLCQIPHHPLRTSSLMSASRGVHGVCTHAGKAADALLITERLAAHLKLQIGLFGGVGEVIFQVDEHAWPAVCIGQVSAVL